MGPGREGTSKNKRKRRIKMVTENQKKCLHKFKDIYINDKMVVMQCQICNYKKTVLKDEK